MLSSVPYLDFYVWGLIIKVNVRK
ncbi:hypothetical protein RA210_U680003 [Rubrivivax sp. A210]|nr:hypothetical protein RA210_U680003 [Rubrivivax sp. A210]